MFRPPMAALGLFLPVLAAHAAAEEAGGPTLAARLLERYRRIETISCEIRKTTTAEHTVRMLSRVFYRRPNLLHVQTVSPVSRTVVCDGRKLYYHEQGRPRGFAQTVENLKDPWLSSLRNIPATPVEHLLRMEGLPEEVLDAAPGFPVRRGYQAAKRYAVVSCDAEGRVRRIDFFEDRSLARLTAYYEYDAFSQAGDGCWIPCLHRGVMLRPDGNQVTEIRHVDNLRVDGEIAPSLFSAEVFFKDVEFSDRFEATYEP